MSFSYTFTSDTDMTEKSNYSNSYTNTIDHKSTYDEPTVFGTDKLSNVHGIDRVKGKLSLAVDGDVYVSGHIYTGNHKSASISQNIKPIKNNNITYYYVDDTASDILYISPTHGPVYVILQST